ncbi:MD-2-related lipid-recognition protein-like [Epargyreus clarus]|uniref:MD-2-related lipid-recognition protein-like n=1 Tax=Epargyreus clarus TaxID=520877 RepID=UPI003C3064AE
MLRTEKMYLRLVCVAVLFLAATAEVANHEPCNDLSPDALNSCTVSQVRITPCANPKDCRLVKGTTAFIDFDFTPNFSASNLTTGLFWEIGTVDVEFGDLFQTNGCDYTACPVESGKSQVLNYSLRIGLKLPIGKFVFKWKLWNSANDKEICCFKTAVELVKRKK